MSYLQSDKVTKLFHLLFKLLRLLSSCSPCSSYQSKHQSKVIDCARTFWELQSSVTALDRFNHHLYTSIHLHSNCWLIKIFSTSRTVSLSIVKVTDSFVSHSSVILMGSSHHIIFVQFQNFLNPLSFIKETSGS